jgi:hypothetical protein
MNAEEARLSEAWRSHNAEFHYLIISLRAMRSGLLPCPSLNS